MSLVLIDTSAWIDYFRGPGAMADKVQECIEEGSAAYCGPILTEILRGCVRTKERNSIYELLTCLEKLETPDTLWEDAGLLGIAVSKKGHTARTLDLLIAIYALSHNVPILTKDRDFKLIAKTDLGFSIINA